MHNKLYSILSIFYDNMEETKINREDTRHPKTFTLFFFSSSTTMILKSESGSTCFNSSSTTLDKVD